MEKTMKIYLLDRNNSICEWWKFYFKDIDNVEIVCEDFSKFMNTTNIECIVSPANSYGLMDGGYDKAITDYFGNNLSRAVQQVLLEKYMGEQPVGTSIIVKINDKQKLIHTPTMRVPSPIKDPMTIYHCMRSTLIVALRNNINSIVIPAFGGDCGNVNYSVIAEMMYEGYKQVFNPPAEITWDYAYRWEPENKY